MVLVVSSPAPVPPQSQVTPQAVVARAGFGRLRVSPLAVAVAAAPLAAAAFRSPLMVRQQFAAFREGHAVVGQVLLRGACLAVSRVYVAAVSTPLSHPSSRISRCLVRLSGFEAAFRASMCQE